MEFKVTLAKSRGELDGAAEESDDAAERMRDEEMAVGDDLQTVGVVHRIVGDQHHFRGNEDKERGETEGDPDNSFGSGTGGAGRSQRGSWHYSPLRWLDVMRGATRARGTNGFMFLSLMRSPRQRRRRRSPSRPASNHQHRPHFHRPTHNLPGRQCSTVTASRGTSAAASNRAQSSSRKARWKDTGPSCRTNGCHPTTPATHPNIRQARSDRSKSLINQPNCAVASIHRSNATISPSSRWCAVSELTTISTGFSGRYARASPVIHVIPNPFGVDSAAARAAYGFKSIPVNCTAMPCLRAQPAICRSRSPPPLPTSTMCTGPRNPCDCRFNQASVGRYPSNQRLTCSRLLRQSRNSS